MLTEGLAYGWIFVLMRWLLATDPEVRKKIEGMMPNFLMDSSSETAAIAYALDWITSEADFQEVWELYLEWYQKAAPTHSLLQIQEPSNHES